MIIDSHAHYFHKLYGGEFVFLDHSADGLRLSRGDLPAMMAAMRANAICMTIEPGISLQWLQKQKELAAQFAPFVRLALGVHPKHCRENPWQEREKLRQAVLENEVVAIGETGLDFSVAPEELDAEDQERWFLYQIELAHGLELPLILHIRDAYPRALELLRAHRQILHGGVAHCFSGTVEDAFACVELGLALGIGGRLLSDAGLQEVVKAVPLSAILVETDAPYIRPGLDGVPGEKKEKKKARNSSLILPMVIDKIAQLRGETRQLVEDAIYGNTLRVFRLERV